MSVLAVARNDVRAALQSKGVWVLAALFVVTFGGLSYALTELGDPTFEAFLEVTTVLVVLLLPLVGVVLGHGSVVDERESGTIALALSLPNGRAELVAGKLLGRAAVLSGPLAVGAVAGGVVSAALYGSFAPGRYLAFVLATLWYGLGFVAIAVTLSSALSSSRRVIGGAFGAYVVLVMLWTQLVDLLVVVLFRFDPRTLATLPAWAETAKFCSPRVALTYLLAETSNVGEGPETLAVETQWFASPIVAVAVLVGWVVLPPALGLVRFRRAEF